MYTLSLCVHKFRNIGSFVHHRYALRTGYYAACDEWAIADYFIQNNIIIILGLLYNL